MRVRGIDASGDWLFGKGKNDYKRNADAVAQSINTRLKCFLGDCFFATSQGIDWFNLLGSKRQIELRLAISATILNTPEVIRLVEVSVITGDNRNISVQYTVETIYGRSQSTTVQEVI